jgi:hypothetical protein
MTNGEKLITHANSYLVPPPGAGGVTGANGVQSQNSPPDGELLDGDEDEGDEEDGDELDDGDDGDELLELNELEELLELGELLELDEPQQHQKNNSIILLDVYS